MNDRFAIGRTWFVLAAVVLQAGLSLPSHAQAEQPPPDRAPALAEAPAVPTQVAPACQAFAGGLDEETVHYLRRTMRNGFVVRHTPVIDAIDIEVTHDAQQLMPVLWSSSVPGDRSSLQVPATFLQDICAIIEFNITYYGYSESYQQQVTQELQDCSVYPETASRCVVAVMAANGAPWNFVDGTASPAEAQMAMGMSLLIRMTTLQTAQYILAHEAAHAVIRSTNTADELELINEEYEADLLAQLAVLDTQVLPIGPLSVLAAQALIEDGRYSEASLHPPAFCRLRDASRLFLGNLQRVMALSTLLKSGADSLDISQTDMLASQMTRLVPAVPLVEPLPESCPPEAPERVAGFSRDIEQLERILRAAQSGPEESLAMAEEVAGLTQETAEGNRLAAFVTMGLRSKDPQFAGLVAGTNQIATPEGRQRTLEMFRFVNDILAPVDRQLMRPSDLAVLMQVDALTELFLTPPGSLARPAFARFNDRFESSFRYAHYRDLFSAIQLQNRLFPDMEVAKPENIMRRASFYLVYIAISGEFGGCDPYLAMARLAQTINPALARSEDDNRVQCRATSAAVVQELARNLGWVWEDQAAGVAQ